jgi:hypothetical protein
LLWAQGGAQAAPNITLQRAAIAAARRPAIRPRVVIVNLNQILRTAEVRTPQHGPQTSRRQHHEAGTDQPASGRQTW